MHLVCHRNGLFLNYALLNDGSAVEFDCDHPKHLTVDSILKGKIQKIQGSIVHFDYGDKRPGILSKAEFEKTPSVGDYIIAQVKREPLFDKAEALKGFEFKGPKFSLKLTLITPYFSYAPFAVPGDVFFSKKVEPSQMLSELGYAILKKHPGTLIWRSRLSWDQNPLSFLSFEFIQNLIETWCNLKGSLTKAVDVLPQGSALERFLFDYPLSKISVDAYEDLNSIKSLINKYKLQIETEHLQNDSFKEFGLEDTLDTAIHPYVYLKSGGILLIEQTAIGIVIDVNQGSSTHKIEDINKEAARFIPCMLRQLQMAGNIYIDFAGTLRFVERQGLQEILLTHFKDAPFFIGWSKGGLCEIQTPLYRMNLLQKYQSYPKLLRELS